jgi:DNA helicase HerA-like ATPase
LNLNDVQSGVLALVFKVADDNGMLLLDFKDLQAMVRFVGENGAELQTQYGNISAASIGAIQRNLLALGEQGADQFFAEPALNLQDFIQTDSDGRGVINILAADQLMQSPKLYSTFLLWMLSELFEQLPEAGDPEKPKVVFFFDEAHLLFDEAPKALVDKIEQVVRLIRSKGVGVYFVTQNPVDLPDTVLGQLGNRVQHALRAFTPRDQKGVKAAAETFRANPAFSVEQVITELGVGEALVSFLDEKGSPTVVDRALVCPPGSRFAPLSGAERTTVMARSPLAGFYEKLVDRESAYEKLQARAAAAATAAAEARPEETRGGGGSEAATQVGVLMGALAKSAAHAIGSQVGRQIIRGVLGSIFGGGKGR